MGLLTLPWWRPRSEIWKSNPNPCNLASIPIRQNCFCCHLYHATVRLSFSVQAPLCRTSVTPLWETSYCFPCVGQFTFSPLVVCSCPTAPPYTLLSALKRGVLGITDLHLLVPVTTCWVSWTICPMGELVCPDRTHLSPKRILLLVWLPGIRGGSQPRLRCTAGRFYPSTPLALLSPHCCSIQDPHMGSMNTHPTF